MKTLAVGKIRFCQTVFCIMERTGKVTQEIRITSATFNDYVFGSCPDKCVIVGYGILL